MKRAAIFLRGAVSHAHGKIAASTQSEARYVNFYCTRKSIQKHIIEANPDVQFDFFMHSWNYELRDELIDLYSPKSFSFENNKNFEQEIQSKLYNGGSFAQVSQFLSFKKACELVKTYSLRTRTNYDYIIAYRPDVMLWKDMTLENYPKDKVVVNKWLSCLGDFHVVFNQGFLDRMIGMYDLIGNVRPEPHHIIVNCFSDVIAMDEIQAGEHQEITRKLFGAYKNNFIDEDALNRYGLTVDELQSYSEII
jgi:hypothetical protein